MRLDPNKLTFIVSGRINGRKVTRTTIDPVAFLTQARDWFKLVQDVAQHIGADLKLTGIAIGSGSAVAVSEPSDVPLAATCDRKAHAFVDGSEPTPVELEQQVRDTRRGLRLLPVGLQACSLIEPGAAARPKPKPITLAPAAGIGGWSAITTLRARLLTLHGGDTPTAKLASPSEPEPFTATVQGREQLLHLGGLFYEPFDVVLRTTRDERGLIDRRGTKILEILQFKQTTPEEATAAWREWLKKSAPEWNDILDVEGELGREAS